MAEQQQGSSYIGAPFPETEFFNKTCTLTLAPSGQLAIGEFVMRDNTQLSGTQSWVGGSAPTGYTPQTDMVIPASVAKTGSVDLLYGVFVSPITSNTPGAAGVTLTKVTLNNGTGTNPTGATVLGLHNTTSTSQTYTINVRYAGYTAVWCEATSAISVGSNLICIAGTNQDATPAAFTGNENVGVALATCVVSGTIISSGQLLASGYGLLNVDLRLV